MAREMVKSLRIVLLLLSILLYSEGYVRPFRKMSSQSANIQMGMGVHGENFKYLSIVKGRANDHFPRVIQIAGVYPELTPEDILAPPQSQLLMPGEFAYDFSDPSGPQMGTIAVPGSDVITFADDPIAIITHSSHLGIKVTNPEGVEIVAIVDRDDRKFNPDCFYIFRTAEDKVEMGSTNRLEAGYEILGRIILTMVPFVKTDRKPATGFLEEEDDWED